MGVHVKYPIFWSDCKRNWIFLPDFLKSSNINFRKNPSSGSQGFACRQTDVPNAISQTRFKMLVLIRNRTTNPLTVQPVIQSLSGMLLFETGAAMCCSTLVQCSQSSYRTRGKSERARLFIRIRRPEKKWYNRNLGQTDDLSSPQPRPDSAADLVSRLSLPRHKAVGSWRWPINCIYSYLWWRLINWLIKSDYFLLFPL